MRRATILDVNPHPEDLAWEQDFIGRMGDRVVPCCGPKVMGGCPILRGDHCSKLEQADGVLFQLNLDREDHRTILARYIELLDCPIRVVCTPEQKVRWAPLLGEVEVMTPPVGPAALDGFAAEVESLA